MRRLIDANAIPYEEHYVPDGDTQWEYKKELCVLKPTIDAMPTVDAVEVVHGRWELDSETEVSKYVYCTNCCQGFAFRKVAELQLDVMPYCPNCGAKMDGGNEDAER